MPFPQREILQQMQPYVDFALNSHHAVRKKIEVNLLLYWLKKLLQSILQKNQHQKIDKVRRNHMQEQNEEVVHEFVGAYITARTPEHHFEGIVKKQLATLLQDFTPGYIQHVFGLRHVEHGRFIKSAHKNSNLAPKICGVGKRA